MFFRFWPDAREVDVCSFLLRLHKMRGENGTTDQVGGLLNGSQTRSALRNIRAEMIGRMLLVAHKDKDVWLLSAWGHVWACAPNISTRETKQKSSSNRKRR